MWTLKHNPFFLTTRTSEITKYFRTNSNVNLQVYTSWTLSLQTAKNVAAVYQERCFLLIFSSLLSLGVS